MSFEHRGSLESKEHTLLTSHLKLSITESSEQEHEVCSTDLHPSSLDESPPTGTKSLLSEWVLTSLASSEKEPMLEELVSVFLGWKALATS